MFGNTSIRVKVSADGEEVCYTCTVTLKISLSGQSFTSSCTWGRVCVPWKPGSALRRKIKQLQAPLHTLSSTGVKGIMETEKERSIEDIVHPSHHCEETLSTTTGKCPILACDLHLKVWVPKQAVVVPVILFHRESLPSLEVSVR